MAARHEMGEYRNIKRTRHDNARAGNEEIAIGHAAASAHFTDNAKSSGYASSRRLIG